MTDLAVIRERDAQDWAVIESAGLADNPPPHTLAMADRHQLLAFLADTPSVEPRELDVERDDGLRRKARDAMQRAAERNTTGRVFVTDNDLRALLFEFRREGFALLPTQASDSPEKP